MIDFDVVTGPGPTEKPQEPASKPSGVSSATDVAARLPREPAPANAPDAARRPPAR